jgi:recombination protein RecA
METNMAGAALKLVEDKGTSRRRWKRRSARSSGLRQGLDHAPGQTSQAMEIEAISTGSLGLDIALGIGGLPRAASSRSTGRKARARRRWRCMWSPKRRRAGGVCAFVDAEHALDPIYAASWASTSMTC